MVKKMIGLSLSVLLMGISSVAFAAPNTVAPLSPNNIGVIKPVPKVKPDLTISITASIEKGGIKPITNGGGVSSNSEWVYVKVENLGPGVAKNFQTVVTVTGASTTSPLSFSTASLNPGASFQKEIQVSTGGLDYKVNITAKTDTAGQVDEITEGNNSATFNYTVRNAQ